MNETPEVAKIATLIRELASMYVTKPEAIQVRLQQATNGDTYFAMRGAPEDDGRLIGASACHVRAMTFLVGRIGKRHEKAFTFRLLTTPNGKSAFNEVHDVLDYDPREARDMLCRVLTIIGIEAFTVTISPGMCRRTNLSFNFDVEIGDPRIAANMTKNDTNDPEQSLISCIGTLFRAIARHNGVRFQVQLSQRCGIG